MTEVKLAAFLAALAVAAVFLYLNRAEVSRRIAEYNRKLIYSEPGKGSVWYMLDRTGRSRIGFVAASAAAAVGGLAAGLAVNNPVAAVMMAFFGVVACRKQVELSLGARKKLIDEQAETALQMIASLYETTGDMVRAIEGAASCTASPMRDELVRTAVEYKAGKSLAGALEGLAERTDNRDIEVFVKGVVLSERYGTDTAAVVTDVAGVIRDRIVLREELVNEMRGQKLTVNVFLTLLPAVAVAMILFSHDARYTITATFLGKALLCFMILVEFGSWYMTRNQGVVEDL
ncbi:MAG: type II secretion system F family protein [Peptococcaceae bacterium]|nr:type II secretion system F family protein [Peptococcaceae bacterium]